MNPAVEIAQAAPQIDMSFWSLFWHAHIVVKLVMMGLLAASIWCWSIIIDKTMLYRRTRKDMDAFEEVFWSGRSLEELYRDLANRPVNDMAAVFVAAMREWKRSTRMAGARSPACRQRIDKVLDVTIQREAERLESKLLVLSTIASAAPFIGLFGTVWGIMNSPSSDRGLQEHLARGRRARHRRGAVRHRDRPVRRYPRADRLQQAAGRGCQGAEPARSLRRRVLRDPVAADRRTSGGVRV
jgi:hypothetical protein